MADLYAIYKVSHSKSHTKSEAIIVTFLKCEYRKWSIKRRTLMENNLLSGSLELAPRRQFEDLKLNAAPRYNIIEKGYHNQFECSKVLM